MYISLWELFSGGIPIMLVLCNFPTKIDGFEQKDSQGFENSYNSYEQYPLEKFFIFTIYQNYTLALKRKTNSQISVNFLIMLLFILSLPVIEKNEDGHIPYSAETKNGK